MMANSMEGRFTGCVFLSILLPEVNLAPVNVHIFDVDHTITRYSSGRRFVILAVRMGMLPARSFFLLPYFFVKYRLGFLKKEAFQKGFSDIKNRSREELKEVASKSFEKYLVGDVYHEARSLIRELRSQ